MILSSRIATSAAVSRSSTFCSQQSPMSVPNLSSRPKCFRRYLRHQPLRGSDGRCVSGLASLQVISGRSPSNTSLRTAAPTESPKGVRRCATSHSNMPSAYTSDALLFVGSPSLADSSSGAHHSMVPPERLAESCVRESMGDSLCPKSASLATVRSPSRARNTLAARMSP